MALTSGEILRIKSELGYCVLTSAAEPFASIVSYFETIVANYLTGGTATTSSTAVTASDEPALTTITLTSATGFAAGDRVWVGAGDSLETSIAQSLSGASLALMLTKAQSGTYPVSVDGGEQIVRELLEKIRVTKGEMAETFGEGSLKRVDELEWYQAGGSDTTFGLIGCQLNFWRDELASALGCPNMWTRKKRAGSALSVY